MIADTTVDTTGPLFTSPDPDEARTHFRSKSRMKANKLMSLKEAVENFVRDGDYLATGGFGSNRAPVAACQEIVRQGRKNMGFAGRTSTHEFQILAAGEVFDRVDIAYIIGMESRGMSPFARAYMESGRVKICEWTNFSLAARLKAAAMGIPFLPTRNMLGTDTLHQSGAKVVTCPFTGKKLVLQPALYPDVAVIHVHEADIYGNCRIRGTIVSDDDLAGASRKLIVTTERLIPTEEIRNEPGLTSIPYFLVDAVCEVPYGAYPTGMPGEYFSDEAHLKEWLTAQGEGADFASFLKRVIHDCPDHAAYIDLMGGTDRIKELRARELMLHKEGIREEL
jgi:glutaconate CoA-transferase, subunit A